MQTTVHIDPDVQVLLNAAVSQQQKTLDEVLNDTLRQALACQEKPNREPYIHISRPLGVKPGINIDKASQLAEELEDEEIIRKLRQGR